MKKTLSTEIDNLNSSTEIGSLVENTPNKIQIFRGRIRKIIRSENVARQIMAVTETLTRKLDFFGELMLELKDEQPSSIEEITSFRATRRSSSGSVSQFDRQSVTQSRSLENLTVW